MAYIFSLSKILKEKVTPEPFFGRAVFLQWGVVVGEPGLSRMVGWKWTFTSEVWGKNAGGKTTSWDGFHVG